MDFSVFINMVLQVLQFFYAICGNYGVAIIFLTIAINLALYPLTLQSLKQMSALQKVQPKMKELQEKYKKDPQTLQKEMMELYKNEKVNPFGGCLPMLLKIPFFILLFVSLQSKEFMAIIAQPGINASFLWIPNLANPDHLYILPILMGISTYFSSKTMPGAAEGQQQAAMLVFMPIFIGFISIKFPSGVQIYWVVSNLVALAQQLYIAKHRT